MKKIPGQLSLLTLVYVLSLSGCERSVKTHEGDYYSAPLGSPTENQSELAGLPTDPAQLIARAQAAKTVGKNDEALFYFVKALEIKPNDTLALLTVGQIHRERGNLDLAEMAYRLVLKTKPADVDALEGLGLTLLERQAYQEAEGFLQSAIRAEPRRWLAQNGLGSIAIHDERYPQAIAHYEAALAIQPHDAQLLTNLGYARFQNQDWQGALSAYDAALQSDSSYESAWLNRGLLLARQGRDKEALASFKHVMNEADAYNDLGYIHMMQGEIDEAYALFEKAMRISPTFHEKASENLRKLKSMHDTRNW